MLWAYLIPVYFNTFPFLIQAKIISNLIAIVRFGTVSASFSACMMWKNKNNEINFLHNENKPLQCINYDIKTDNNKMKMKQKTIKNMKRQHTHESSEK